MRKDGATSRWQLALLAVVLATVGVVAFHPYGNLLTRQEREYPVHMDEFVHWGAAEAILAAGDLEASSIFTGDEDAGPGTMHERGFQAYLAVLHDATGIAWPTLFRFVPALVAMLTALAVFVVAQRWGAGLEAALLVAAVPTTLRFLGPGFLVPIAWTLPILALGIHIVLHERGFRSYLAIGLLCAGLWPIHAMGGLAMASICALAALVSMDAPARAAALLGVASLPALVALPLYQDKIDAATGTSSLGPDIGLLALAGLPLFVAGAIGATLLILRPGRARAGVLFAGLLLAGQIVLYAKVQHGANPHGIYDRTFTLLPFLATLPAGIAFAEARTWLAGLRIPRTAAVTGVILLVIAQGGLVAASATAQMEQPYYEPVTAERFEEYASLRDELSDHRLAIVEGQTMPFTLATGLPTLYVFLPIGGDPPDQLRAFFQGGGRDTMFLLTTGTTVVVTERALSNPYLEQKSATVYVLNDETLARLHDRR